MKKNTLKSHFRPPDCNNFQLPDNFHCNLDFVYTILVKYDICILLYLKLLLKRVSFMILIVHGFSF